MNNLYKLQILSDKGSRCFVVNQLHHLQCHIDLQPITCTIHIKERKPHVLDVKKMIQQLNSITPIALTLNLLDNIYNHVHYENVQHLNIRSGVGFRSCTAKTSIIITLNSRHLCLNNAYFDALDSPHKNQFKFDHSTVNIIL